MKILAIGAHPDDIEYGCGGTLAKFKEADGSNIEFFVATYGELSGGKKVRISEQEEAMKLLGADKIFWGGIQGYRAQSGQRTYR
ncbi:MAG: PIG-L family deacetylase [Candidatus Omnitrophica bacterium]|nr:PIG-L family deacetylase [Candidatus Omnitrophota bacterium]